MRISLLFRKTPPPRHAELARCRGTLVLHADGTLECEHEAVCGTDELQHELWVACDELGCGCIGDDVPIEGWLLAA